MRFQLAVSSYNCASSGARTDTDSGSADSYRHLRGEIHLWGAAERRPHRGPGRSSGHYSTKINVHNNTGITIVFRKKVIQLKGGQVPTEPAFRRQEKLPPNWAMEVVCRDIYGHLNIAIPPVVDVIPPYIEGFVVFEVNYQVLPSNLPVDPLDVEGIYTYRAEPAGTDAVAIDVVTFPVKRNRHALTP